MKTTEAIYHYFLPHESNNFKARFLHSTSLVLFISFVIFFQLILQLLPSAGVKILGYAANISPDEVIRLTNEQRIKAGLQPLTQNIVLSQAALAKGTDMLNKDYWAHIAPDGTEPWKFFIDFGYKYRYAGENLARDFSNPSDIVSAWMVSPTHKDNILSSKYKEIGIAVVEGDLGGVDTTLVIQLFGTKLSDAAQIAPVAAAKEEVKEFSVANVPTTPVANAPVPKVSPFNVSRTISLGLTVFLMVLLLADVVIVAGQRIKRVGGKVFAHIAFLGMVLAILVLLQAGSIL